MSEQPGAKPVIRGHALRLLLATLATLNGYIAYREAVRRAARLMGREAPTRADVTGFSTAVRRLQKMGAVKLGLHTRQVKHIASRRALFLSTKLRKPVSNERASATKSFDRLVWQKLPDKEKEEYLGIFAAAAFRTIISSAIFFLAQGLSLPEAANALKNTTPTSLSKALELTSARDREALVEVAWGMAGQTGETLDGTMYFADTFPPAWAYRVPKPGQEQIETVLAVAEVVRLAQQKGLDPLARLLSFGVFMRDFAGQGKTTIAQ